MANLTTKELTVLSGQLNLEKTLYCKYQEVVQECAEEDLKPCFQQYADQHRQDYDCPPGYLKQKGGNDHERPGADHRPDSDRKEDERQL